MRYRKIIGVATLCMLILPGLVAADEPSLPGLSIKMGGTELAGGSSLQGTIQLFAMIAVFSFAPALALTMTCFTRISIVLNMTKTALGTPEAPPALIITGLSLLLTATVMSPVMNEVYREGLKPYLEQTIDLPQALAAAEPPMKRFLVSHTREKDLELFLELNGAKNPASPDEVPFISAAPAFVISELQAAFQIGFLIALPFLVLDLVVAAVLTSLNMITLPPAVVALPLKLLLFVMVDGWQLLVGSLIRGYGGG